MPPASPATELKAPVFIVTGANSGIGKETARQLLATGAHVVLACRNAEACEVARADLMQAVGPLGGTCECGPRLDLEDFQSVHSFAAQQKAVLQQRGVTLAGLVNNAGVMGVAPGAEGEDHHLRANHLGPYLLTRLMAPAMGPGSRIVNVSSRAHYRGGLTIRDNCIVDTPTAWWGQYARSKLCNVLMTAELSRRLGPRGVTSYSVSPGLVNSSIFKNLPAPLRWAVAPLGPWLFRTPAQGALSVVYAATSPELAGRSELFIHDCKPRQPSALAQQAALAEQLWNASALLVGLEEGTHEPEYL